jgi:hypothetical protein
MLAAVGCPRTLGDDLSRANRRLYAAELTANEFVGPPLTGLLVATGAVIAFAAPVVLPDDPIPQLPAQPVAPVTGSPPSCHSREWKLVRNWTSVHCRALAAPVPGNVWYLIK